LTHFYDLLTYLMTVRGTSTSRKEDTWQNNTRVFDLTYFSWSQRSKFIWVVTEVKVHLGQVANNPQLPIQTMSAECQALGPLVWFPYPYSPTFVWNLSLMVRQGQALGWCLNSSAPNSEQTLSSAEIFSKSVDRIEKYLKKSCSYWPSSQCFFNFFPK
jgi:hypothetical protein